MTASRALRAACASEEEWPMHIARSSSSCQPSVRPLRTGLAGVLLAFAACQIGAADLTDLTLEQLLDIPIYSASKFEQRASDSPAAVTVVTREDIRTYGWRTLSEVLRSVRGFYVHYDHAYEYVGIRGFARPQDYNSRLLLLIDGYRTNDPIYDMAYIGTDAVLDLDLVERIEIVRGPGSSVYGGNALFGVVNVITRNATQIGGTELGLGYGSFDTWEGRASYGRRFANGSELVASISGMHSDGPDLYFPEFDAPESSFGRTDADFERNWRFFGRLSFEGLRLTAAASSRDKGYPTGAFGTLFGDPSNATIDSRAFVDLSYYREIALGHQLSGRLFWADYTYNSPTKYASAEEGAAPIQNDDNARGNWWGAELKLVSDLSPKHKLVAGIEYQKNYRQNQSNYDDDPYFLYYDDRRRSERAGVFAESNYQWTEAFKLSLGARYDKVTGQSGEVSPRVGLVYRLSDQTVAKALYGSAFRAPNAYELRFTDPSQTLASEKIKTWEAGIEHYLTGQTRLLATGYRYRMEGLLDPVVEVEDGPLRYQNVGDVTAEGLELEAEHQWSGGARLRASLDLQRTEDKQNERLTNSPRAQFKLNASAPLPWWSLLLGAEGQWMSSRKTDLGSVPGFGLVNLTLSQPSRGPGWEWSATVRNLFDRAYFDPAAFDVYVPDRDRFEQLGRTFRLKGVLRF
jgi:iron complex outermembrane receptor protein